MSIQETIDALESRTLQLSLKPEEPAPLFSLPSRIANALLLDQSKAYTIGNVLTAFHTYILNHSLAVGRGLLKADGLFTPAGHSSHIPYSSRPSSYQQSCASHIPYSAPSSSHQQSCASHIPYSAALKNLCEKLKPA